MQKKLVALAVAGALTAPALAYAQATSTVQIFGRMYMEGIKYDQKRAAATAVGGPEMTDVDMLRTAGSEIGIRGEEKLGGGMSAWFQCASTADLRGSATAGWCTRNSAIGLRGGFGNIYAGIWDTPFKRALGLGNVASGETGGFGNAMILVGGTGARAARAAAARETSTFSRRESNLLTYDSPAFGGFRFSGAVSANTFGTVSTSNVNNNKPRTVSASGTYVAGPLSLGLAYEQHQDVLPATAAPGAVQGDDDAYVLTASYQFGPVRVGGVFSRQRFDVAQLAAPTVQGTQNVKTYHLGVDWRIQGPHSLRFGYTKAGDVSGPVATVATAVATRPAPGANTGASFTQIKYAHALSKRTEFAAGWSRVSNKAAAAYNYSDLGVAIAAGQKPDAFVVYLDHRF